jgi:hypothetical protein
MKTYNDNLVIRRNVYDGRRDRSLAEGTGEPLDPPCPRGVAPHTVSGSASIDVY